MSLEKGAETIVLQCLDISEDEKVLVLNDGNDQKLLDSVVTVLNQGSIEFEYLEYEEPENHGEEPPEKVSEEMKNFDVFIAPTKKSLSHTKARVEACESGSRGATLPGINQEIWKGALDTDYSRVKHLSEKVYRMLEDTEEVRIETPSGTDLEFKVDTEYFHTDTGIIHQAGGFGNLPAGEADGAPVEMNGKLVVDHLPFAEDSEGLEIRIEDNRVVETRKKADSILRQKFEEVENSKNVAEFGFGTNPEAELIGNILQDEKVLGTVHIAFGDNTSYVPEGDTLRNECGLHWDTVCRDPTVYFDGEKVLENGEPVFLDS